LKNRKNLEGERSKRRMAQRETNVGLLVRKKGKPAPPCKGPLVEKMGEKETQTIELLEVLVESCRIRSKKGGGTRRKA